MVSKRKNAAINLENEADGPIHRLNAINFRILHLKIPKSAYIKQTIHCFRFNRADNVFASKRGFKRENEGEGHVHGLYTNDFRIQHPKIDQVHLVS
jgi:hypothetical protein